MMEKFVVGFVAGIMFTAFMLSIFPSSYHSQAKLVKEECEKTLPRNQECKVIAIPVELKETK